MGVISKQLDLCGIYIYIYMEKRDLYRIYAGFAIGFMGV
jgi:hypothetical protein